MAQNKIISVQLYGGVIGMLMGSPKMSLERSILKANRNGYEVVQIIESSSGNLALNVIRLIILVFTIFLFTLGNGYYIILRKTDGKKVNSDNSNSVLSTGVTKELLISPEEDASLDFLDDKTCSSCGSEVLKDAKFCENCGKPL